MSKQEGIKITPTPETWPRFGRALSHLVEAIKQEPKEKFQHLLEKAANE